MICVWKESNRMLLLLLRSVGQWLICVVIIQREHQNISLSRISAFWHCSYVWTDRYSHAWVVALEWFFYLWKCDWTGYFQMTLLLRPNRIHFVRPFYSLFEMQRLFKEKHCRDPLFEIAMFDVVDVWSVNGCVNNLLEVKGRVPYTEDAMMVCISWIMLMYV